MSLRVHYNFCKSRWVCRSAHLKLPPTSQERQCQMQNQLFSPLISEEFADCPVEPSIPSSLRGHAGFCTLETQPHAVAFSHLSSWFFHGMANTNVYNAQDMTTLKHYSKVHVIWGCFLWDILNQQLEQLWLQRFYGCHKATRLPHTWWDFSRFEEPCHENYIAPAVIVVPDSIDSLVRAGKGNMNLPVRSQQGLSDCARGLDSLLSGMLEVEPTITRWYEMYQNVPLAIAVKHCSSPKHDNIWQSYLTDMSGLTYLECQWYRCISSSSYPLAIRSTLRQENKKTLCDTASLWHTSGLLSASRLRLLIWDYLRWSEGYLDRC